MTLLQKFKVSGHSMMPTLKPNQEILVSSIPYLFRSPKVGDVIAFKMGRQYIVKRLKKATSNRFQVAGDNQNDSKDFGWIERKSIIGKVIYIHS